MHTAPLKNYFFNRNWILNLNYTNKEGTFGLLGLNYARLLRKTWSNNSSKFRHEEIHKIICQYNSVYHDEKQ
jgi:hypothetical protein